MEQTKKPLGRRGGSLILPGDFSEALGDLLKVKPPPKASKPTPKGKRKPKTRKGR